MTKAKVEAEAPERSMESYIMECSKDRYKLPFAALRWAKEIKQKENLPDPLQNLIPRAMKEILTGKTTIGQVEKLPLVIKVAPQPAPTVQPQPTISLSIEKKDGEEKK